MRLLFVRHGQTDNNAKGLIQGWSDPPLNSVGLAQAEAIALVLRTESFDRIITSPLLRARQTAEAIGKYHPLELEFDDRLIERGFGQLQDQPYSALVVHPETGQPDFFFDGYQEFQVEPICDMMSRVTSFLRDLTDSKAETILLVAHGGIGYILTRLFQTDGPVLVPKNGQVYYFDYDKERLL